MLFNSPAFLFVFLPIAFFVYWRLETRAGRHAWLALTGYAFYACWNYRFCAVMAFSTTVTFLGGLGLLHWQQPLRRRICLVLPVAADLALLGFFKYANFAGSGLNAVAGLAGHGPVVRPLDVVLPVGISFYTFHTISYIVDSYRGVVTPTRHLLEFASYVSFFPQLVAGPITRFRDIQPDLATIDVAESRRDANRAWSFFALGFAKKVLVADTIAAIIDPALADYHALSSAGAWLCALGYTYQLYFDFSGYSDMAVGLGLLFGVRLPQNFNSPYKARDIADFWRRWHISLSTVFRDYLFVPLDYAATRRLQHRGTSWWRDFAAYSGSIMVTMLLCGLWHGAAWTFVAWGAYHACLLIAFRLLPRQSRRPSAPVAGAATFLLVVVGWVLFRSTSFSMAFTVLGTMFSFRGLGLFVGAQVLLPLLAVAAGIAHAAPNTFEMKHDWSPAVSAALCVLLVGSIAAMYGAGSSPFLYFQF